MNKLIIIRGSSGVGKSSVVKEIIKNIKDEKLAYIPSAHTTYSLITDEPEFTSDALGKLIQINLEALINNFLKAKYDVLTDAIFYNELQGELGLDRIIKIAKKHSAKVYLFELEASLDVLIKRAKKRARSKDLKTNFELIKKKYEKFNNTRKDFAIKINTENKSIKQVANKIITKLDF